MSLRVARPHPACAGLPVASAQVKSAILLAGLRATVAVRGGLDAPLELGSRSRDTLSGIGPEALTAGGILAIGDAEVSLEPGTLWWQAGPGDADSPRWQWLHGAQAWWLELVPPSKEPAR